MSESVHEPMPASATTVHVRTRFQFEVNAPFRRVSVLFGAESEKGWAGEHWQPEFLYPQPGKDTEGAVFTVPHGLHKSYWVNTLYEVTKGRMQYVAIIPDVVATVVDVTVTRATPARTRVEVSYTRTALDAGANDEVRHLARRDRQSGPEWRESIQKLLVREQHGKAKPGRG